MNIRIVRSAQVTVALAATLLMLSAASAQADPVSNFISPQPDPALYLPTPLGDPWFDPPAGYEASPLGTVLHTRSVSIPGLGRPTATTQILFRSTDSKDRPIAAATSVIVPTAPWTGSGPRPVVSYNIAIDGLGNTCAPSYTLPRGTGTELDTISSYLANNYAVVVTDYEGPRQAYSAGLVSGHTVLDSLKAAVNLPQLGLSKNAPIGITGYSGGAIASAWAAQLAPTYSPALNIKGVAFGGPPADYAILHKSLNGGIGSGLYLAASGGLSREYPELIAFNNDNGLRLLQINKDKCSDYLTYTGLFLLSAESLSKDPNSFYDPLSQKIIAENKPGAVAPTAPIYIYQGKQDFLIPKENAENLADQWCAGGASVRLEEITGEHTIAATNGKPLAVKWLSDRLNGIAPAAGCSSSGR